MTINEQSADLLSKNNKTYITFKIVRSSSMLRNCLAKTRLGSRITGRRLKLFLFFLLVLTLLVIIFVQLQMNLDLFHHITKLIGLTSTTKDGYIIRTNGCSIIRYDPWEKESRSYIIDVDEYRCPRDAEDILVRLEDETLIVNLTARNTIIYRATGLSGRKQFDCRLWTINRHQMEDNENTYHVSNNYTTFNSTLRMRDEYAKVMCFVNDKPVYHNYFFRVKLKEEVERESRIRERTFLKQRPQCDPDMRLSVLIIGVDSMSKSNFFRQFPVTYNLLLGDLSAIEFLGYNRVGINTFPSLMPYMMGQSKDDLIDGCWGGAENKFDNCSTVFHRFEAAGYRTAFVENLDQFGLFTYYGSGFTKQLAHYYGRTLYLAVRKHVKNFIDGCWRGRSDDEMLMEWAYQFQNRMRSLPHFGHFWMSRISHDDLNTAKPLDGVLAGYIRRMISNGLLNSTLLIMMSDHGMRYGDFPQTEMGHLEENLPYMFLMFPEWFRIRNPLVIQRLRENRHRLITNFDLHQTLVSLIDCQYNNVTFMADDEEKRGRSVSLFQKVTSNRTCKEADIPLAYCSCEEEMKLLTFNS